ncbi:MAG: hypothetical protein IPN77_03255 [Sandaracinaceae bacterium]|nr:hypothetical protein [Sandaracinaceae bacterium]
MTDTPTSTEPIPPLLAAAWHAYGDERPIVRAENISATVSTNTVYRVTLSDKKQIIAKTSSYGSYVHFRQDHDRIHDWTRLLSGSRFGNFLAPVLTLDGKAFTFRDETGWVAFYGKTEFYDFLPKVLTEDRSTPSAPSSPASTCSARRSATACHPRGRAWARTSRSSSTA